jgi:hypothetical protein
MDTYRNTTGGSNILAYLIGSDFIVIRFRSGRETFYKYTYSSAGKSAIETMKLLAQQGSGLNSYVSSKSTSPRYEQKGVRLEDVL